MDVVGQLITDLGPGLVGVVIGAGLIGGKQMLELWLRKGKQNPSDYVSQSGFERAQRQNHEDHEKILNKLEEFNKTMIGVGKTISAHEEKHKSHNRRLDKLEKDD